MAAKKKQQPWEGSAPALYPSSATTSFPGTADGIRLMGEGVEKGREKS